MYTKADLIEQIEDLGIRKNETLLIHSSMKAVGEVEGRANSVIDAFMEYLEEGLLVFPTHTWEQMSEEYNLFDPKTEPSCVGILSNLFMKRPGVYRSLHPTHSVAAYGNNAKAFVKGEEKFDTPCPRKGCWGKLYDWDSKILFIGCTLRSNTIIHGVEEWNDVPNRLSKEPQKFKILNENGSVLERTLYRHYNKNGDISKNYKKLTKPLIHLNIAQEGRFGDANTILCRTKEMVEITNTFLKRDINLFLNDKAVPCNWYK